MKVRHAVLLVFAIAFASSSAQAICKGCKPTTDQDSNPCSYTCFSSGYTISVQTNSSTITVKSTEIFYNTNLNEVISLCGQAQSCPGFTISKVSDYAMPDDGICDINTGNLITGGPVTGPHGVVQLEC